VAVVANAPIDARPGARRRREAGRLLESLATTSRRRRRGGRTAAQAFTALFAPLVTLQIAFGRLVHGREPTEEEMEPLSWALWQLVRGMSALDTLASAQLHSRAAS
jgi:hypothetical protein